MIGSVASPVSHSPLFSGLPGSRLQAEGLSPEDQKQVQELRKRDAEVRAHEQAHLAAGAGLVRGGASFQYVRGPDGKSYAVGGEVSIDVSPANSPQETIRKAQQIRAAALAPQDPSAQDRAVATRATQMESQARGELAQVREEAGRGGEAAAPGQEKTLEPGQSSASTHSARQALQSYAATAAPDRFFSATA